MPSDVMPMQRPLSNPGLSVGWLATLGSDMTKLALGLYLLGTTSSIVYYSRFSILTLDLIKAQAILVGCYVIILYVAVPITTLWLLKGITGRWLVVGVLFVALASSDSFILVEAGNRGVKFAIAFGTMIILQFVCFVELRSAFLALEKRQMVVRFHLLPSKSRSAAMVALSCAHFALTVFPGIPMYFGGAKPLDVQVFTKIEGLAAIRVAPDSKNRTFNASISSYGMHLLYESEKEMYFLTEVTSGGAIIGYLVTRIPRDEIVRVDYQTPEWVTWR